MFSLDDEAFLRTVCAAPEDDIPRLVYSDYLEESGHPVRVAYAEFIRLQCTLARAPASDARLAAWRERESGLLLQFSRDWNGPVHRRLAQGPLGGRVRSRRAPLCGWAYRRGFITAVTIRTIAALEHAEALALLGPLEQLRVRSAHGQVAGLLASPVMRWVRDLDLSGNHLSRADVEALLRSSQLAGLRTLDLRRTVLPTEDQAALPAAQRAGRLPAQTWFDVPEVRYRRW